MSSGVRQENVELRLELPSCFTGLECFLMPAANFAPQNGNTLSGPVAGLNDEFVRHIMHYVQQTLMASRLCAKKINGQEITCGKLVEYFHLLADIFNADSLPTPETLFNAIAKLDLIRLVEEAKTFYVNSLNEVLFCYILMLSPEKNELITRMTSILGGTP